MKKPQDIISTDAGEIIAKIYAGKKVQAFLPDDSVVLSYADDDRLKKTVVKGTILWGLGDLVALKVEIKKKDSKKESWKNKTVIINCWHVQSWMEEDEVIDISDIYLSAKNPAKV